VEAAHAAGMEVVSHTETHFDGSSPKFTTAFIKTNLEQSLTELDAHLGKIPRILVYPYGHYTPEYIAVAKELGFTMGLTTHFGYYVDLDDPMLIPRVRVHGGEPMERFQEILTGKKLASSKK
jgi:peptidoglycan/xylan/chitin deacetylase (PgdA/CDA1 family)